jgi:hypothetical protein
MDTTTAARPTAYEVLERFLAGYWTRRTRDNYRFILTRWLDWCHEHRLDPVGGADAAALEAFIAELKTSGYAPNTIVGRVSAISAFYRWRVRERLADRNPVELIRRPSRPAESSTASLTRHQLTDWLAAAESRGGAWWAAAILLGRDAAQRGQARTALEQAAYCGADDPERHRPQSPARLPREPLRSSARRFRVTRTARAPTGYTNRASSYGFALQEKTLPGDIAAEAEARREALTSADPSLAEQFPYLIEVVKELGASGYDYTEQFERGLDLILDRIEQIRQ